MLIKIYTHLAEETANSSEQLHLIENAKYVVIHQGNWEAPAWLNSPVVTPPIAWGPTEEYIETDSYCSSSKDIVRIIDYTDNVGARKRALIKSLAYVCNDQGKTIERVAAYSGAKLSVS